MNSGWFTSFIVTPGMSGPLHCHPGECAHGLSCDPMGLCELTDFWDPMGYSPPGSSIHWILLARILEWLAISSFRGSSPPRD